MTPDSLTDRPPRRATWFRAWWWFSLAGSLTVAGTVGTPYAARRASDCYAPSGCAVGASLRRRSWWPPPEDATQHPLECVHEGIAAEMSSGAFMPAKPKGVLGIGAFAEERRPARASNGVTRARSSSWPRRLLGPMVSPDPGSRRSCGCGG